MNDLKINAAAVTTAATQLKQINHVLRDQFSDVQKAIQDLDAGWKSKAAVRAVSRFGQIRKNYVDARFYLMEQSADCLTQQIVPGYQETETENNTLADAYK